MAKKQTKKTSDQTVVGVQTEEIAVQQTAEAIKTAEENLPDEENTVQEETDMTEAPSEEPAVAESEDPTKMEKFFRFRANGIALKIGSSNFVQTALYKRVKFCVIFKNHQILQTFDFEDFHAKVNALVRQCATEFDVNFTDIDWKEYNIDAVVDVPQEIISIYIPLTNTTNKLVNMMKRRASLLNTNDFVLNLMIGNYLTIAVDPTSHESKNPIIKGFLAMSSIKSRDETKPAIDIIRGGTYVNDARVNYDFKDIRVLNSQCLVINKLNVFNSPDPKINSEKTHYGLNFGQRVALCVYEVSDLDPNDQDAPLVVTRYIAEVAVKSQKIMGKYIPTGVRYVRRTEELNINLFASLFATENNTNILFEQLNLEEHDSVNYITLKSDMEYIDDTLTELLLSKGGLKDVAPVEEKPTEEPAAEEAPTETPAEPTQEEVPAEQPAE